MSLDHGRYEVPEKPCVLVVDDEASIRMVCSRYLARKGYRTDMATNGQEALAKLLERDYDLVLTDVQMPNVSGVKLIEEAKAAKPYVPFIVMTAYASIDIAVTAMKNGAYDFLLKPLDLEQLEITLDRCLQEIRLKEENKVLRLANERLQELHQLKDKFLSITSHELRTPVSTIKGFAEFLMSDEKLSSEDRKMFYQILRSNLEELEEIVDDMHSITAAENGHLALHLESHDINESVRRLAGEVQEAISSREQTLALDLEPSLPPVEIDELKIRRALRELVENAIKFTPDGGRIVMSTRHKGDDVAILVQDDGIGIPKHEQRKVFQKFYEVQDSMYHSTSKIAFRGGGMGLGLNIAKSITEAHGGRIELESEEGEGCTFAVVLPVKRFGA